MIEINAKDCLVGRIIPEEEKKFLSSNPNSNGYVSSTMAYGLFYRNKLIKVMSFGTPRFNKHYQWEIIRNCNKDKTKITFVVNIKPAKPCSELWEL